MKNLIFLALILFFLKVTAQQTGFNKLYSFPGHQEEAFFGVAEADSGYMLTGQSFHSPYGYPFIIAKINLQGDTLWHKTINNWPDYGYYKPSCSIVKTSDGYYATVTTFRETSGLFDPTEIRLFKFDEQGDTLWSASYGADINNWSHGLYITETQDSGFVITGYSSKWDSAGFFKVILLKTDSTGNEEWVKTYYAGTETNEGWKVEMAQDKGYWISGLTKGQNSSSNVYIIKTDSAGNEEWSQEIGNSNINEGPAMISSTSDTGCVLAFYELTEFPPNNWQLQLRVLRMDKQGDIVWDRKYGLPFGTTLYVIGDVITTPDGGFIIAATVPLIDTTGGGIYQGGGLYRLDAAGNFLWAREYDSPLVDEDQVISGVQETADGGFILCGGRMWDDYAWVVKTDSIGCAYAGCDTICPLFAYTAHPFIIASQDTVLLSVSTPVGFSTDFPFSSHTWDFGDGTPVSSVPNPAHIFDSSGTFEVSVMVNWNSCTLYDTVSVFVDNDTGLRENEYQSAFSVYPVPADNILHISRRDRCNNAVKVEIISISGQGHLKGQYTGFPITLDLKMLTPGLYFIYITSGDGVHEVKKLIKQ